MKTALKNQLKKIKKQAAEKGLEIKIQESSKVAEIIMIGCPSTQKVVMLVVDQLSSNIKPQLRAFTINLKKWNFTIVAKSSNSSNKVNSKQCSGIAKSTSKRCRNNTKNENGYCYLHQSQSSDYVPPAKTNYKGRCTATTKKRTQCKRNASDGTKYCWQHQ